jgi:hypothetical protein
VKDTVEVDFNVSRHLDSELAVKDWDALVHFYSFFDAFSLVFSVVPQNALSLDPNLVLFDKVPMISGEY